MEYGLTLDFETKVYIIKLQEHSKNHHFTTTVFSLVSEAQI